MDVNVFVWCPEKTSVAIEMNLIEFSVSAAGFGCRSAVGVQAAEAAVCLNHL